MKLVGVIGCGQCENRILKIAYEVGKLIGEHGYVLINGGLSGVMEYSAKGAKEAGGLVVGILPSTSRYAANKYVDIPITTGMNEARNIIIARTADILVAIDGKYGTLSEIVYGLHFGKTIIGIETNVNLPIKKVNNPEEAILEIDRFFNKNSLFD